MGVRVGELVACPLAYYNSTRQMFFWSHISKSLWSQPFYAPVDDAGAVQLAVLLRTLLFRVRVLLQSQGKDPATVQALPSDSFNQAATTNLSRISLCEMSDESARCLVLSGWDTDEFNRKLQSMPPDLWCVFNGSGQAGPYEQNIDCMLFGGMWFEFNLVDYGLADPPAEELKDVLIDLPKRAENAYTAPQTPH